MTAGASQHRGDRALALRGPRRWPRRAPAFAEYIKLYNGIKESAETIPPANKPAGGDRGQPGYRGPRRANRWGAWGDVSAADPRRLAIGATGRQRRLEHSAGNAASRLRYDRPRIANRFRSAGAGRYRGGDGDGTGEQASGTSRMTTARTVSKHKKTVASGPIWCATGHCRGTRLSGLAAWL